MSKNHDNLIHVRFNANPEYSLIHTRIFYDERLSLKAKGIFAMLFAMGDRGRDYSITAKQIIELSKDGKDSVYAGLKELQLYGYLTKHQKRTENGMFVGYEYILFEQPVADEIKNETNQEDLIAPIEIPFPVKPCAENPFTGKPETVNPTREKGFSSPSFSPPSSLSTPIPSSPSISPPSFPKREAQKSKKSEIPATFQKFYELYPRKKSPDDALKAWRQKNPDAETVEKIYAAIEAQKREYELEIQYGLQPTPWKYPATWLRAGAWKDHVKTEEEIKTEAEKFKGKFRGTNSQTTRKGPAETPLDRARRIRAERRAAEQQSASGNIYEG